MFWNGFGVPIVVLFLFFLSDPFLVLCHNMISLYHLAINGDLELWILNIIKSSFFQPMNSNYC